MVWGEFLTKVFFGVRVPELKQEHGGGGSQDGATDVLRLGTGRFARVYSTRMGVAWLFRVGRRRLAVVACACCVSPLTGFLSRLPGEGFFDRGPYWLFYPPSPDC